MPAHWCIVICASSACGTAVSAVGSVGPAIGTQTAQPVPKTTEAEVSELLERARALRHGTTDADVDHLARMIDDAEERQYIADRMRAHLDAHPDAPERDAYLVTRLEALYLLAVNQGRPLAHLRVALDKLLAENLPDDVRHAAEYWKLRLELIEADRSEAGPIRRRALMKSFVEKQPAAREIVPLVHELVRAAEADGDFEAIAAWLDLLTRHHPAHVTTRALLARQQLRRRIGKPFAPDLPLPDGGQFDWATVRDRAVIMVVCSAREGASRDLLSRLISIQTAVGSSKIAIVPVFLDVDPGPARRLLDALEVDWPLISDGRGWNGPLPEACGIRVLPTVLMLDANHHLQHRLDPSDRRLTDRVAALAISMTTP